LRDGEASRRRSARLPALAFCCCFMAPRCLGQPSGDPNTLSAVPALTNGCGYPRIGAKYVVEEGQLRVEPSPSGARAEGLESAHRRHPTMFGVSSTRAELTMPSIHRRCAHDAAGDWDRALPVSAAWSVEAASARESSDLPFRQGRRMVGFCRHAWHHAPFPSGVIL